MKRLGHGLLEVVAPEIADEAEYQRLVAEEKRSHAATRLHIRDAATDPATSSPASPPRREPGQDLRGRLHLAAAQPVGRRPAPAARRRGEAFCALLENLPVTGLPKHGGTATSVMVMLDLETLRPTRLAETSTGDRLTAEEARRLACQAGIIPVVLGGKGEILDLGRARRLFSSAQRKAMALRDRGCTADGCDVPAAWCEAHHHRQPWCQGGKTDLADGKLLCPSTTTAPTIRAGSPPPPHGSTSFHRRT